MSYSTVYLIQADYEIAEFRSFKNSWGFGPFVWDAVCEKYFHDEAAWLIGNGKGAEKLWPLSHDKRLSRAWRAALLCTYDYAIIEKARFREIAKLLNEFVMDVGIRDRVCHLPAIAEILNKHADDNIQGMCFYGTSTSNNVWFPYNETIEETEQYDIKNGRKVFFVGEQLDSIDKENVKGRGEKSTEP